MPDISTGKENSYISIEGRFLSLPKGWGNQELDAERLKFLFDEFKKPTIFINGSDHINLSRISSLSGSELNIGNLTEANEYIKKLHTKLEGCLNDSLKFCFSIKDWNGDSYPIVVGQVLEETLANYAYVMTPVVKGKISEFIGAFTKKEENIGYDQEWLRQAREIGVLGEEDLLTFQNELKRQTGLVEEAKKLTRVEDFPEYKHEEGIDSLVTKRKGLNDLYGKITSGDDFTELSVFIDYFHEFKRRWNLKMESFKERDEFNFTPVLPDYSSCQSYKEASKLFHEEVRQIENLYDFLTDHKLPDIIICGMKIPATLTDGHRRFLNQGDFSALDGKTPAEAMQYIIEEGWKPNVKDILDSMEKFRNIKIPKN